MADALKVPDWLPVEVAADLKARYPDVGKLIPVKTELGAVVLRPPSREAILARYPPPPKPTEARGMLQTDDGDLDKDIALALASVVYPDEATLKQYLVQLPMLAPYLAARAKVAAAGIKGEVKGVPADLPSTAFQQIELSGAKGYQIFTDLEPDRLVLRVPSTDAIRQWENARARQSGITASETLLIACLLHPAIPVVHEQFSKRPLLSVYCANRLLSWGRGDVEEFEGGL